MLTFEGNTKVPVIAHHIEWNETSLVDELAYVRRRLKKPADDLADPDQLSKEGRKPNKHTLHRGARRVCSADDRLSPAKGSWGGVFLADRHL